jgi:hypothetical protein
VAEGDGTEYRNFRVHLGLGYIDLVGDTIKAALLTGYTPSDADDEVWSDISAYDYASAGNYTAGGKALTGKALAYDDATGSILWNASDPLWNNLGPLTPATPDYLVLYSTAETAVGSPLIARWELGSTATNGGPYTVTINSLGLMGY